MEEKERKKKEVAEWALQGVFEVKQRKQEI
jgi:hypothetical protein